MIIRWNDYDLESVTQLNLTPFWMTAEDGSETDYGISVWILRNGEEEGEYVGELIADNFDSFDDMKKYAVSLIDKALEKGFFDMRDENIDIY